jgi:hypothetical protein
MKVKLDHYTHTYTDVSGSAVSSYSDIIKFFGFLDTNGKYRSITGWEFIPDNGANTRGQYVHDYISYDLKGKPMFYDDKVKQYIDGWHNFKRLGDLRDMEIADTVGIEKSLGHSMCKYAGTPDLFYIIRKQNICYLWDWKTTSAKQPHWQHQMDAYRELIKSNYNFYGKFVIRSVRIHPNLKDGFKVYQYKEGTLFLNFLNIYNHYK